MYKFWSRHQGLILLNEDIRTNKIVHNINNTLLIQSLSSCVRTSEIPIFNGSPLVNYYEVFINTLNTTITKQ
jgi:hypothetical protein